MFYKNFPKESSEWILPLDIDKIMSSFDLKSPHDWIHLNTNDVLSDKGQMWFLEKEIHLSSICLFFISYPNEQCPIHIDHKINDAGFNFVLSGSGSMQWLDVGNAEEYPTDLVLQSGASMKFTGFSDVRKLSILDSWQGDRGMVRVGTPHRIVTFKTRRICLSLRQASGASKTFDELITAF